jgi:uncharacterized protein YndB with AHSA1/START domain
MGVLLRFILAFTLLAAVLAAVGLVLPGAYRVERTVTVAAPPEAVYPLVGDLARWREWSPWAARDPNLHVSFSATTTGAGAWAQWRSASQEGGRAEIVLAQPPERVDYRMTYADLPVAGEGSFQLVSTGGGGRTVLTWTSQGRLGWNPLVRWSGLLMKRQEGQELERGLASLQARVAAGPQR